MLSIADVSSSNFSLTKNLVSDQTFTNLVVRLNSSGIAFSANGLGTSTATSTVVFVAGAGFNDQRMTATMRYTAPTAQGSENLGVVLRVQSIEDAASTTYYYARCNAGVARITRVVASTFTTLASSAFVLPQDTDVTITFSAIGSALSATFDAGGSPATVELSAVDTQIPSGGFLGFRTTSATGIFSSFTAEQL